MTDVVQERPTSHTMANQNLLHSLAKSLVRSAQDPRPIIVMMCGIAGSGKTTIAKAIVAKHPSYERLSIDEIIAESHGLWGQDYPADKHAEYQDEADAFLQDSLLRLLQQQGGARDVIVDRSFWARASRDAFRALVRPYNVRLVLVYLQSPSREFSRQRIDQRRREQGQNANSALDIDDAMLDAYWAGFEPPEGEDEIVIKVE